MSAAQRSHLAVVVSGGILVHRLAIYATIPASAQSAKTASATYGWASNHA